MLSGSCSAHQGVRTPENAESAERKNHTDLVSFYFPNLCTLGGEKDTP